MSIRLRILGYAVTLVLHISNIVYMARSAAANPSKDERVQVFKSLEYRFMTTWTFLLQIAYAMLGLVCDLLTMWNQKKKDFSIPQPIEDFRNIMFGGLVWPSSWVVFTVFWSLYVYDRSLIYPVYLDQVIPPLSNHIIHTIIIPIVVWEVVFRPRSEPETHARNIMQLTMHGTVYLSVLMFTYIERGLWLYPIFAKLYGTIYFGVSIIIIGFLFLFFYYIQWPLTYMLHGNMLHGAKDKLKKKKQ